MDILAILALIGKGITIANSASDVAPKALAAIGKLVKTAQGGSVTDEDLAACEAVLDELLEELNLPIPNDKEP